jgi:hypothetical protein
LTTAPGLATVASDERRAEWICRGCDVRVRNVEGRPILEPAKWADERCPKCRVELALSEGGKKAADEMEERLGWCRKKPRGPRRFDPVEERRKQVALVVGEHPDWSNQRVAGEIGSTAQAVWWDRSELGLPIPKSGIGLSDEQRAVVERELRETVDSDKIIAGRVGVAHSEVAALRNALGILPSPQRRTQAVAKAVAETLAAHPSWFDRQVAEAVGVDVAVVRYHRRALASKSQVPSPPDSPRAERRKARRARVAAYAREHPRASIKEIATALGEPFGTIRHDRYDMTRAEAAATAEAVSVPA